MQKMKKGEIELETRAQSLICEQVWSEFSLLKEHCVIRSYQFAEFKYHIQLFIHISAAVLLLVLGNLIHFYS